MRRARRGGREVSFVVLVHQDHEKRKKKNGKHGCSFPTSPAVICAPPPRSAAVRHRDTGSPRGSSPRSKCWFVRHPLHLAAISSWCVTRSSCRSARRGIEPSRVPRRDGRRSMGRVFADDEETRPRVRERSRTRLSSRGRFPRATRFRRLARARRRPRLDPLSRRETPHARVVVARASVLTRFRGDGKTRPLRGIFQSARG